jgi:hypothetical protein
MVSPISAFSINGFFFYAHEEALKGVSMKGGSWLGKHKFSLFPDLSTPYLMVKNV